MYSDSVGVEAEVEIGRMILIRTEIFGVSREKGRNGKK